MQSTQLKMETADNDKSVIEALDNVISELGERLKAYEMARETILNLGNSVEHKTENVPVLRMRKATKTQIPSAYNKNGSYKEKILYILNLEGEATTPQIEKKILDREPELDVKKVHNSVTKTCTRLEESGVVRMEKIGNSNLYILSANKD